METKSDRKTEPADERVKRIERLEELGQGNIYSAMLAVMKEVEPIAKERQSGSGGGPSFKFRGIDDVYAALQQVLAKNGVFTMPIVQECTFTTQQTRSGNAENRCVLKVEYNFYADDGTYVTAIVIGEGMDPRDKAANKAMSVAHKYALLQAFCIPTEDPKDPERDGDGIAGEQSGNYDAASKKMTKKQSEELSTLAKKAGFVVKEWWPLVLDEAKVSRVGELCEMDYYAIKRRLEAKLAGGAK